MHRGGCRRGGCLRPHMEAKVYRRAALSSISTSYLHVVASHYLGGGAFPPL